MSSKTNSFTEMSAYSVYSGLTLHTGNEVIRSVSLPTAFFNKAQYRAANQNRGRLHVSVLKAQ